jgi:putative transposase
MAKDLRPAYTVATEQAAQARYDEFAGRWVAQYPAIGTLWQRAWPEFVPFLDYDVEIRRGPLQHERHRVAQRPLPTRGPRPRALPTEQAALKCLYLVTRSLDPTGKGRTRWSMRWKPTLATFAITSEGRSFQEPPKIHQHRLHR